MATVYDAAVKKRLFRHSITVWIARLAVLMAALMPLVSQALAANTHGSAPILLICSTDGPRLQVGEVDRRQHSTPADRVGHLEHCPFCLPHAGSFGLPPSPAVVVPATLGEDVRPPLFFHAPRRLFAWAPAQSRAPPVRS